MSADQKFTPFTLQDKKAFSDRVKIHHTMIQVFTPLVLKELDCTLPTPGQTFVLGDYGTADGGTSYDLIRNAIALLREKHGNNLPIQIVYEDQPINNFAPIFLRASDLARDFPNVFVLASGTSFYLPCLPPNSVDFIVSLCATHWLSKRPEVLSPELFPTIAIGAANEAFKKQSEEDWANFLLHRATELKPGGCLIVTSLHMSDKEMARSSKEACTKLTDLWKGMLQDGLITKREFEFTHAAYHHRTSEELEKPFKDKQSRVSRSGLVLTANVTHLIPSPHRERGKNLIATQPPVSQVIMEHAMTAVGDIRSWLERQLWEGLDEGRTANEKQRILDAFFEKCYLLTAECPWILCPDLCVACLVIRKTMK